MPRTLPSAFLFIITATLVGCGGGDKPPPYANVTGTVTFNGKPLERGTITFATDGRPPTVIDITDGNYTGQAMTGSNKISISSKKKGGKAPSLPPMAQAQMKAYAEGKGLPGQGGGKPIEVDFGEEIIPAEWNAQSKQLRVIEAGTTNKLDFDIKSK